MLYEQLGIWTALMHHEQLGVWTALMLYEQLGMDCTYAL